MMQVYGHHLKEHAQRSLMHREVQQGSTHLSKVVVNTLTLTKILALRILQCF